MTKQIGPTHTTQSSCFNCSLCKSERYVFEDGNDGDSGHNVYCTHENVGKKYIGDTTWSTPDWCPVLGHSTVSDSA